MTERNRSKVSGAPAHLIDAILRDDCVLFLGDGIYGAAGLPRRDGLAKVLARKCDAPAELSSLPAIAQFFERELGDNVLRAEIQEAFSYVKSAPKVYRQVASLPVSVVASLTYDGLLESLLEPGTYDSVLTNVDAVYHQQGRRLIVRLTGRIDHPESLILTEDDHYGFQDRYMSLSEVLRALIAVRTPIFVGCDLEEPLLKPFYRNVARGTGKHSRRAYAIDPSVSTHVRDYWEQQNLTVVAVEPEVLLSVALDSGAPRRGRQLTSVPAEPGRRRTLFKFLAPFDEADSEHFFGRDNDIRRLIDKVACNQVTILYAQSGAGKTSLIRAGLGPALEREGYRSIYLPIWRDPISHLDSLLTSLGSEEATMGSTVHKLRAISARGDRLVVFLDGFEQVFVSTSITADRLRSLVSVMQDCLSGSAANIRFVIALREDFLADLFDIQQALRTTFANQYRLRSLSRQDAREAIEEPIRQAGLRASKTLVSHIIDELSNSEGYVYPPQLQIVCDRVFDEAWAGHTVGLAALKKAGGIRLILANYVNEVLRSFRADDRDVAKAALKALVTSHRTRTKVTLESLVERLGGSGDVVRVLGMLEDNRLIRQDEDEKARFYELTHEYVIGKIAEWISEEEYKSRRAQELVDQEYYNWTEDKHSFMSVERFGVINSERERLELDSRRSEFLLMTALHRSSELEYWIQHVDSADVGLQERLLDEAMSGSADTRRNAAMALTYLFGMDASTLKIVLDVLAEVGNPNTLKLLRSLGVPDTFASKCRGVISSRFCRRMVEVPAGPFVMGSTVEEIDWVASHFDIPRGWIEKEIPQAETFVETFYIDRFLVTNAEFGEFAPDHSYPRELEDHPAVNVDWRQASEYAEWLGKRLPSEAEWEKAARGTDGRRFPWGNEFDPERANSKESGIGTTTPVDAYPAGLSPYGCYDMAGNVFEWTNSLVRPYPYVSDARDASANTGVRIMRGGAFSYNYSLLRCALRYDYYDSSHASSSLGFRCVTTDAPGKYGVP